MNITRPPAVAGAFYPGNPSVLAATVNRLLAETPAIDMEQPKALIVPHAGYIYSGSTAAMAYATLAPWRLTIRRVVLLGPTHRVAVDGIALPKTTVFATPLGDVMLDRIGHRATRRTAADRRQRRRPCPGTLAGSATALSAAGARRLHPGAAGRRRRHAASVAEVLELLWGGPETLIVISSDLSHFLPLCRSQPGRPRHRRAHSAPGCPSSAPSRPAAPTRSTACCSPPASVAWRRTCSHRCNSGDTAGDRQRVVGYAAFCLCRGPPCLTSAQPC